PRLMMRALSRVLPGVFFTECLARPGFVTGPTKELGLVASRTMTPQSRTVSAETDVVNAGEDVTTSALVRPSASWVFRFKQRSLAISKTDKLLCVLLVMFVFKGVLLALMFPP